MYGDLLNIYTEGPIEPGAVTTAYEEEVFDCTGLFWWECYVVTMNAITNREYRIKWLLRKPEWLLPANR